MSATQNPGPASEARPHVESIESAAISGLFAAGLLVAAQLLMSGQPGASDSSETIAEFYADSTNRLAVIAGFALTTFAVIAFLWFMAVIRRRVGDREDQFFATVFLGSGILVAAILLLGAAVSPRRPPAPSHLAVRPLRARSSACSTVSRTGCC